MRRVESESFPPAQSSSSSVAGVAHVQQPTEGHTRSKNRAQITMQDIIMQPQESVLGSGCKRSLVVSLKYQKTLDGNTTAYSKPRPGSLLDGHHQEEQYGECGAKTIDSSEGRPRKIARLRREADATSNGARLEHDQDASETICVAPVGQSRPVNAQASRSSNCAHSAQVAAEQVGINKTLAPAPDAAAELAHPSAPQLDHDRSTSTASYQPPDKYPPPAKGNQSNHKSTATAERSSPPIKRELEANPTSPFTEGQERSRSIATPSASSTPLLSPNLTVNTTPESWLDFGLQAWTREPRRSCAVEDSEAELNCRSPSPLGQDLVADRSPSSTTHQMQSTWPDEPRRGLTVNRSSGQTLQRQPPMMAPSPSRSNQNPQSVPAVSPRQAAPDQPPVPVRYIVYWDRPPRAFSKGWPEGKLSGRTLDNLIAVVAEFSGQTLVEGIKFQLQTAERQWVYVVRRGAEDEYEIVKIRFFNEILIASKHSTACVKVLLEPLQSADVDRYQGENAETVDYSWRL
ncbi:MAG: hypothetical protein M1825_003786 [Sarcosagium campestre]|nr:MAG: hypothetical protein M1825_003786 [Sarcosagium campestre]